MPIPTCEREKMLAVRLCGPRVITRLPSIGITQLRDLADRDPYPARTRSQHQRRQGDLAPPDRHLGHDQPHRRSPTRTERGNQLPPPEVIATTADLASAEDTSTCCARNTRPALTSSRASTSQPGSAPQRAAGASRLLRWIASATRTVPVVARRVVEPLPRATPAVRFRLRSEAGACQPGRVDVMR